VRLRGWCPKTDDQARPCFEGLKFASQPRKVSADNPKQRSIGTLKTLLVPEYFLTRCFRRTSLILRQQISFSVGYGVCNHIP
jgi:hypothetical protein